MGGQDIVLSQQCLRHDARVGEDRHEVGVADPAWHDVLVEVVPEPGTGGGPEVVARITSYNVCYTKLLRLSS